MPDKLSLDVPITKYIDAGVDAVRERVEKHRADHESLERRVWELEKFRERALGFFLAGAVGGSALGAAVAKIFGH